MPIIQCVECCWVGSDEDVHSDGIDPICPECGTPDAFEYEAENIDDLEAE